MKNPNQKNLPKKAKSNPAAEPLDYPATEAGLTEAFIDSDEMREFFRASDIARDAQQRGDKEVTLPAPLMAHVLTAVQPLDLDHLIRVWNRLCDELGLPDQKKPIHEPTAEDMTTGKKTSVRKKPLHYKPDKGSGGGEEGPF